MSYGNESCTQKTITNYRKTKHSKRDINAKGFQERRIRRKPIRNKLTISILEEKMMMRCYALNCVSPKFIY